MRVETEKKQSRGTVNTALPRAAGSGPSQGASTANRVQATGAQEVATTAHAELRPAQPGSPKPASPTGDNKTEKPSPQNAKSLPKAPVVAGRAAANPAERVDQSAQLSRALFGDSFYCRQTECFRFTHIAGIFSPSLRSRLEPEHHLEHLMPTTLRTVVKKLRPDVIVIDQAALRSGPWFGTESAQGAALFRDLLWLLSWARTEGISVFFVETSESPDVRTNEIRKSSSAVIPLDDFSAGESDVMGTRLTGVLLDHANELIGQEGYKSA